MFWTELLTRFKINVSVLGGVALVLLTVIGGIRGWSFAVFLALGAASIWNGLTMLRDHRRGVEHDPFSVRRKRQSPSPPTPASLLLVCPACTCAIGFEQVDAHVDAHLDALRDDDERSVAEKLGRIPFVIEETP